MKCQKILLTIFVVFIIHLASGQIIYNYFNGNQFLDDIELNWQTDQENNMDYFTLERSIDNFNYTSIQNITAGGNTALPSDYSHTDVDLFTDTCYYYRLKSVHYNGQFEYSDTVSVCYNSSIASTENSLSTANASVYPNPVTDGSLTIAVNDNNGFKVILFNCAGHIISTYVTDKKLLTIDTNPLSLGLYYVQIENSAGGKTIEKVVIE